MYQILKAEKLADKIYLMEVEAPRVARSCEPGEFVIVRIDEEGERIPLTICDYDLSLIHIYGDGRLSHPLTTPDMVRSGRVLQPQLNLHLERGITVLHRLLSIGNM